MDNPSDYFSRRNKLTLSAALHDVTRELSVETYHARNFEPAPTLIVLSQSPLSCIIRKRNTSPRVIVLLWIHLRPGGRYLGYPPSVLTWTKVCTLVKRGLITLRTVCVLSWPAIEVLWGPKIGSFSVYTWAGGESIHKFHRWDKSKSQISNVPTWKIQICCHLKSKIGYCFPQDGIYTGPRKEIEWSPLENLLESSKF